MREGQVGEERGKVTGVIEKKPSTRSFGVRLLAWSIARTISSETAWISSVVSLYAVVAPRMLKIFSRGAVWLFPFPMPSHMESRSKPPRRMRRGKSHWGRFDDRGIAATPRCSISLISVPDIAGREASASSVAGVGGNGVRDNLKGCNDLWYKCLY